MTDHPVIAPYANLVGADLRGADLRYANLFGADLRCADLRDADLRDATLRGADLRDAILCGADLHRAIVDHATPPDDLRLMFVHVGGPRRRPATAWRSADISPRLRQGCIDVTADDPAVLFERWADAFRVERGEGWTDAQIAAAARRVEFAIEELFAND